MKTYVDTSPVVYVVEPDPVFGPRVRAKISTPGDALFISDLTCMECRVKPLKDGNAGRLRDFDRFFAMTTVVPLNAGVFDVAADIRARQPSIKTADAIHLAAALVHGCDRFLTNDHHLTVFQGIPVELI